MLDDCGPRIRTRTRKDILGCEGVVWPQVCQRQLSVAEKLSDMGFQSTIADSDVWLRAAAKGDGEKHYEYVLMYVDDILAISAYTRSILEDVQHPFKLKNDHVETPEFYHGA